MKDWQTFTDIEYSMRKMKTKREEFLEIGIMDEWVSIIEPYHSSGGRGRPPIEIEKMLRMYLLQIWFNLSDPGTEEKMRFTTAIHAQSYRNRFSARGSIG